MSRDFENVSLYVRHFPDTPPDATHPNPASVELGSGIIQVGVNVEGVDIPLVDTKASDLVQRIDAARAEREKGNGGTQVSNLTATAGQPGTGFETPPNG